MYPAQTAGVRAITTLIISSGVTSSGLTVSSGEKLIVESGGHIQSTTILSGGSAVVSSGGYATGTIVSSGGQEIVAGLALQAAVLSGGSGVVSAGGVVSGLSLPAGANLLIDGGGMVRVAAVETFRGVLSGSGALDVVGSGDLVLSGASSAFMGQAVISGGIIELPKPGTIGTGSVVFAGGTASKTLQIDVNALGDGGTLANVISNFSGETDEIDIRGFSFEVGVTASNSGSTLVVSDHDETMKINLAGSIGSAFFVTKDGHGGVLIGVEGQPGPVTVSSGVTSSGLTVGGGEALIVESGGDIRACTIINGGSLTVSKGGDASGTVVTSGGRSYDHGVMSGTIVSSHGAELIYGSAVGTVVKGGDEYVYSGGVASRSVVSSGAEVSIFISGIASQTVLKGGKAHVSVGGRTSGTVVSSGGYEYVSSGGLALQTVVSSGGSEVVSAGGVASGLAVLSGGALIDDGAVVNAAARTYAGDLSGSGALAVSGFGDLVLSGAGTAFAGTAVINGGTIELAASGAIGTGSVVFAGGTASHTLQIDAADAPAAGGTFANVISNFSGTNDSIDLRNLAFVSGATAAVSGQTLTLTDGGKTYKFTLAGSIGGSFPVTSDGHGGTLIDPQVGGFAQATAAFSPLAAGPLSPISSGGATAHAVLVGAMGSASGRG